MRTVLPINGKINRDVDDLYVDSQRGEVKLRQNARVMKYGDVGVNVSHKGMTELVDNFPSGYNTCVGWIEDKERDRLVFCNYNSNNNHGVYAVKGTTVTKLSEGAFWNFSPSFLGEKYKVSMDVIGDYVYLTDKLNPPRKLYLKDDVVPFTLNANGVKAAMDYPTSAPTVVFGSDTTKKTNKLIGKAFQFAYFYIYKDNSYSVLSPYSELAVSPTVFSSDDTTLDSSLGNFANVTFDVGADSVSEVVLLCREGNSGDWFIAERHTKENETAYAPISIDFYNDRARVFNTYSAAENYYSDVPRLAKANAVAENRLVYAGVVKGYDIYDVDFDIAVEYEDVVLGNVSTPLTNNESFNLLSYQIAWVIPDTIEEGAVFLVSFNGSYNEETHYDFDFSYSFAVSVGSGDTPTTILNAFASDINNKGTAIITKERTGHVTNVYAYYDAPSRTVGVVFGGVYDVSWLGGRTYSYSGTFDYQTLSSGVNTYKGGSFYNVGLVDCDDSSRTAGVVGTKTVYIPHSFERDFADAYKSAVLKFTINDSSAPSWSDNYKFAVTESINFSGVYNLIISGEVISTTVDSRKVLAIPIPSNIDYSYVNGDYAIIESGSVDSITAYQKTVLGTRTLITNEADEEVSGFWLIIPDQGESIEDAVGNIVTVYRPKDEVETNLFFEDIETYEVISGVRQTLSGYIRVGDAWIRSDWFTVSNAGKASTGITLDTGTSGTAEIGLNLGGGDYLLATATFDTDYETTAKNFVYENSSYFLQNGFFIAVDGAKIYITDNTGDYAILVPVVNNLTGDLEGTTDPVADENDNLLYPATVEDFYIDIDSGLRAYNKGRVIVEFEDDGEVELQDVVWSNAYLDNTKVNGLSMFISTNRVQLDEKDGNINDLVLVGDVLKAIQDNKETSLYIGKEQVTNADGSLQLVKTGNFIGTVYPSIDDFGTRFPKSVVKHNRNLYYFDMDKSSIVRSSPNGQVDIAQYGIKSELLRIAKSGREYWRDDILYFDAIFGYDTEYDELICTFDLRGNVETWVFKEGDNEWVEKRDYTKNDNPPSNYGNVSNQMYAFLDGVWKMDDSTSYNTFFGENKPFSLTAVLSVPPNKEKCLRALEIDSTVGLDATITSPVTNTFPYGQKSVLFAESWRDRLGNFVSPVLKNIMTPTGENMDLILSGADMVGKFLTITLSETSTDEIELRLLTCGYTVNN